MRVILNIGLLVTTAAIVASSYGCDRVQDAFSREDAPSGTSDEESAPASESTDPQAPDESRPGYRIRTSSGSNDTVDLPLDSPRPHHLDGDIIGRNAATEFGATCTGFIGEEPAFSFDIEGDAAVETSIAVLASGGIDTTLVLDGPGGPYCDDDSGGATLPRLRESLPPGTYTVYIGTYLQNQGAHFRASVGPGLPRFDIADCDDTSTIEISEGFSEQNLSGAVEEDLRPCRDGVDAECDGYLPNTPGPCVEVSTQTVVKFTVTRASFDSVMVLQARDSEDNEYNDDGFADMRSEIVTVLEPGSYALHVGTYESNALGPWTVKAQALDLETDANGRLMPTAAQNCEVLEDGETVSLVGVTTPEIGCDFFFPDQGCLGTIPMEANHCIEVPNGMSVDAEITEANFDTVLLLSGDSIFLSDDDGADGASLLSKISTPLPAGVYQLFIGSIDPKQAGPYRLQLTPR